ncbi:MAG TPA: bifunctional phosphoglucose/phosphomannose isomerase [Dehalococcoidales bacterium]|nr:bifunctional phosphoglucose/phosphomannose isomerase [Dehalococcoidales bacterium]
MLKLDTPAIHSKLDKGGMTNHLRNFPVQLESAWDKMEQCSLPADFSSVNKIVILGMGGSAIGGEVAASLVMAESNAPVWVQRGFELPRFVDENTLVIAVSYSGNTEETLSAMAQLLKTRAQKFVLTSGGKLSEIAAEQKIPLMIIDYKAPPRATFAYMFSALVCLFTRAGFITPELGNIKKNIPSIKNTLAELDITSKLDSNPAKQLAVKIHNRIPIVYGAGLLEGVARRWKTQFNENGKCFSYFEVFPELIHNATCGFVFPEEAKQWLFVNLLTMPSIHPRIKVQYEALLHLLDNAGVKYQVFEAKGDTTLAQMLNTILLGDFASYYLAILNNTDPSPVPTIDFIKKFMADKK